MYKLIIGNVRITVSDDTIAREPAATAARQAISIAQSQGKSISHIAISAGEEGLEVKTTEKAGTRVSRKTIKHSMLDGMYCAINEKLYPSGNFSNKDAWYDVDTGQEWRGSEVDNTRDDLVAKFEAWMKTI
ncbi:MAG: hypothetical protein H7X79_05255 [Sporomusaceae bacterium]|nr:hypothetical protein [Sporomusaceae bacterium]